MKTNFFQQQAIARKKTFRLVILFMFVVGLFSLFMSLILYLGLAHQGITQIDSMILYDPLFQKMTAGVAFMILAITLIKILTLGRGGEAVALMVGATPLDMNTKDPLERRLINVVEEMAIASGVPVPKIFVMLGEPSLNAFAAGLEPQRSVIAVTQGLIEQLDRDELQGVIAHEFSHIFNGDMALNVKLLGAISGLVFMADVGRAMMRVRSRGRKQNSLPLIGFALFVVGYLGVLFSQIIKAAISREREYLADASASQFTRNPSGLASALAKILHFMGSIVNRAGTEQVSHFFFSDAVSKGGGLFSTHPPVEDRISKLDPSFLSPQRIVELKNKISEGAHPTLDFMNQLVSPEQVVSSVAQFSQNHLAFSQQLLTNLPVPFRDRITDPKDSLIVTEFLIRGVWTKEYGMAKEVSELIHSDGLHARGLLLSLLIPALRSLDVGRRQNFIAELEHSATQPEIPKLQWAYLLGVKHSILPGLFGSPFRPNVVSLRGMEKEVGTLVRWMLEISGMNGEQCRAAFSEAMEALSTKDVIFETTTTSYSLLNLSVMKLKRVPPVWKERVILAIWKAALFDQKVLPDESEAVRFLCIALGVPVPALGIR